MLCTLSIPEIEALPSQVYLRLCLQTLVGTPINPTSINADPVSTTVTISLRVKEKTRKLTNQKLKCLSQRGAADREQGESTQDA